MSSWQNYYSVMPMESFKPLMHTVYRIETPPLSLPLVLDSPHSGREYPADFGHSCPFDELQKAEDSLIDELFAAVPEYGGTLLCALFPRSYIDVNRAVTDIDPALLAAPWPGVMQPTDRSHAGSGLIRRLVKEGTPVYDRSLDPAEILHRIDNYYTPYHEALQNLIDAAHYDFGQVWHVNCHSMPSAPGLADFVLGDRDGTTCSRAFTHTLYDFLRRLGYRVTLNDPYKGVEILRRHGRPHEGRHSIQIEINRALYWNESRHEKSPGFDPLQGNIGKVVSFLADYVSSHQLKSAAD